jgi:hypothetical protein
MLKKLHTIPEEDVAVIRKHAHLLGLQEIKAKITRPKKERTPEQIEIDREKMRMVRTAKQLKASS